MITIMLPPELEQALTSKAQQQDTTPELLALESLREQFLPANPPPSSTQETLADYLADFIGSLDSSELVPGGARMSENTGKQFAEGMLQKRQEGHL